MLRRHKSYGIEINIRAQRFSNYDDLNNCLSPFVIDMHTNSIADLYGALSQICICGFGTLQEGKLMGLSSYGTDTYVKTISNWVKLNFLHNIQIRFTQEQVDDLYRQIGFDKRNAFVIRSDLAYAIQKVTEDCVYGILNYLYKQTKCSDLWKRVRSTCRRH